MLHHLSSKHLWFLSFHIVHLIHAGTTLHLSFWLDKYHLSPTVKKPLCVSWHHPLDSPWVSENSPDLQCWKQWLAVSACSYTNNIWDISSFPHIQLFLCQYCFIGHQTREQATFNWIFSFLIIFHGRQPTCLLTLLKFLSLNHLRNSLRVHLPYQNICIFSDPLELI